MQTKCPHCETIFRLTDAQLSIANGKVRCGLCHHVFTASPADEDSPFIPISTQDESSIKHNVSADKLSTQNITETENLLLEDIQADSVIPAEFRHLNETTSHTHTNTLLWTTSILLMLLTLISEYTWFNRNQLAQNTELEPWVSRFCNITNCTLAPLHKPELIKMVNRNVYTHPNIKKALMITATMVNIAPSAQAYPDVEIGFSNVRGTIVTQRTFTPDEYMKMDTEHLRLLQPNTPVTFGLEIKDPGKQAMTYEFNFL